MAVSPEHKQTLELLAEHEASRAVIETALFLLDQQASADRIIFQAKQEKLAVSLSNTSLTLSILHTDIPLQPTDFPSKKLFLFPSVSFAVSLNQVNEDLPPVNARVFATDTIGRPVDTRGSEFSIDAFEQVLSHTTAELGIYRHVHELRRVA
jgi:hypothetical protein